MEIFLSFVLWAGFVFVIMRMGNAARAMQAGQHQLPTTMGPTISAAAQLRWLPPEKDTDPVCQKVVVTAKAKPSVFDGDVYYFCSRDCREIFEAAPNLYVGGGANNHQQLEKVHV